MVFTVVLNILQVHHSNQEALTIQSFHEQYTVAFPYLKSVK